MHTLLTAFHFFICFFLIVIVLLQAGKGADIGAAFGAGSSQTIFGPRGAATFLSKLTAFGALLFIITSLALSSMSGLTSHGSVLGKVPETTPAMTPTEKNSSEEAPLTNPETQK